MDKNMKNKNKITVILIIVVSLFASYLYLFAQEANIPARPVVRYSAEGLRDPFRDYLPVKDNGEQQYPTEDIVPSQPPKMDITGIIWGTGASQAIINGKVVKVGDVIEEAKITEISKDGVSVLYKNRKFKINSPAVTTAENLKQKSEGGKNEE